MSIRILAQELYRTRKKVEELQRRLAEKRGVEGEALARELREAEREMATLQKMFDAKKSSGQSGTFSLR